jgi:hypothetical protein
MLYVTVINDYTGKTVKSSVLNSTKTEDVLFYLEPKLKKIEDPLIKKETKFIHSSLKIYKVEEEVKKGWIYNSYKPKEVLLYTSEVVEVYTPFNDIKRDVMSNINSISSSVEKSKLNSIRDEFINELKLKVAERSRRGSLF